MVNPSYVFGPALDRRHPGETSNRLIGNYLLGRLPAVVDSETNAVDVRDVAAGHLLPLRAGRRASATSSVVTTCAGWI